MASKKLLEDTPGSSDFETEEETEYSDETPTPRKQPVAPAAATVREGNDDERSAPSVANARTAVPAAARAKAANSVSGDSFEYEDEEEYSYTNTSELAKPSPKPQQLAKTAVAAPAAGASKPAVVAPVTVHAISDSAESTEQSPVASARKPAPAKFGGGKGKSEDSPRAAGKGNTRRGMSVDSFEDSEQQRTKPRAAVPPSGRMDDDNFDSDTDAVLGAAGFGANYERATVRGEELSDMGGRGGGMLSSSMSEEDDGRRLPLMPAARLRFVQLPEPLPPAGKRTDNGLVTGKVELEDVIDVLDHTDPMLRITQSKIRGYRDYLHVVEREEVNLIRDFTSDVGKFAAQQVSASSVCFCSQGSRGRTRIGRTQVRGRPRSATRALRRAAQRVARPTRAVARHAVRRHAGARVHYPLALAAPRHSLSRAREVVVLAEQERARLVDGRLLRAHDSRQRVLHRLLDVPRGGAARGACGAERGAAD